MSSPNEKKPYLGTYATYRCQRRTGKMKLVRRATYLDMRRMYGVGAKLAVDDSDEQGEGSKVSYLGKNGEGSKENAPAMKTEVAEEPSMAVDKLRLLVVNLWLEVDKLSVLVVNLWLEVDKLWLLVVYLWLDVDKLSVLVINLWLEVDKLWLLVVYLWYAEKFVKGQWQKEECVVEWEKYRECLSQHLEDKQLSRFLEVEANKNPFSVDRINRKSSVDGASMGDASSK
uniref:Uncharacterized protein n=1 Tax=Chenopodium quinoa TaxID=63459 RepID=A0A803LYK9_CHEQI